MRAEAILRGARDTARRHALFRALLLVLPWLAVAGALAWRLDSQPGSALACATAVALAAAWTWQAARGFDDHWLARRLDAQRPDMEDSAGLLFAHAAPETALEHLQRARLRHRLEATPALDLRAPWRGTWLAANTLLGVAFAAAILLWPARTATMTRNASAASPLASADYPARLTGQHIDIRPPAYTGLPSRRVDALAARVPAGSTLQWTLQFAPMPAHAGLVFLDGSKLPLRREGDAWVASRRIDKAMLYRLEFAAAGAAAQPALHRLDVVLDQPPQLRTLQPMRSLTVLAPGQRSWALAFEASDDYGLARTARLRITRTEGSGENITAKQQLIPLRGVGTDTRRRYTHAIDLALLGLVAGDDVIAQLEVSDRRAPTAQSTRSPSYILRWPPEAGTESTGLDGLLKKAMPAYFRSQRQIIIDAEALLKDRRRLAADAYVERSDGIGVDQRLLRLRYGQFLGEESEGAPQLMPTNDAEPEAGHDDEEGHAQAGTATAASPAVAATQVPADDHGHAPPPGARRQATFGEEQSVLEEFGHTHDVAEAATLLDPGTRQLLKSALDEMWQSELHLRQGQPERALPYANRALGFIKQVQQASRIYLARVGLELPPIDESRRLGGDRTGLGNRGEWLAPAPGADPVLAEAWRALAPTPTGTADGAIPDLDALTRWLGANEARSEDPLALAAAVDAVRRDRACGACRERLRTLLWPLLARPPAAAGQRRPATRSGDAYLDALGRGATP